MSDNSEEMKEIPICGDGWLAVFDLVSPRQLGLEIALLSHRFDYFVDEHFKTRKWTLGMFCITYKEGYFYGTKEMQIVVNADGKWEKLLPIPHKPVPNKVVGFKGIVINHFDQNVVNFLHHFRPLFSYATTLAIFHKKESESVAHPMLSFISSFFSGWQRSNKMDHLHFAIDLLLNDKCPLLRSIYTRGFAFFPEFPPDGSATATDGQVLAKWLFTPRPDGVPKVLACQIDPSDQLSSKIDALKVAFANASFGANFIIFLLPSAGNGGDLVMPFELFNNTTGERLTLTKLIGNQFVLVRCPIALDEQKWEKEDWGLEGAWNRICVLL